MSLRFGRELENQLIPLITIQKVSKSSYDTGLLANIY